MSWDPPSPIDNMWEANAMLVERLDQIIALLNKLVPKEDESE